MVIRASLQSDKGMELRKRIPIGQVDPRSIPDTRCAPSGVATPVPHAYTPLVMSCLCRKCSAA